MSKIELSLSSDYVPSWTLVDAIRELFQNALDQEAVNPDNKMSYSYNPMTETFFISNKKSVLTTQTLLLGHTTKESDSRTIGQFGEGYKIATLVLLRNDKKVTIYNYGAREVWTPRFVKSRRFDANILTFFIDKKAVWDRVPDNDLTIEVQGITQEEWDTQLVPANLHLQGLADLAASTDDGQALASPRHAGLVFVGGLYVCKYEPYKYGYNFKPGKLKLDRDRKLASDFDLRWLASKLWRNHPRAAELAEQGLADVAFIADMYGSNDLQEAAYNRFRQVYGPHAVPVSTQAEAAAVPPGWRAVVVTETYKRLVKGSHLYEEPDDPRVSPLEQLKEWLDKYYEEIPDEATTELEAIIKEMEASEGT